MISLLGLYLCLNLPQTEIAGPWRVSLMCFPGDDEALLTLLLAFHEQERGIGLPKILTAEPGPIDLAGGLRLLPNELPPRQVPPDLLVISNQTLPAALNDSNARRFFVLEAFLRRCLAEGTLILVIGEQLPAILAELDLLPGQRIDLVSRSELRSRLETMTTPEEPM